MENISIVSDISSIPTAIKFAEDFLEKNGLDFAKKTAIVFDEILSNIAKYAYKGEKKNIDVGCDYDEKNKKLTFKFEDFGTEFNPLGVKEADTTASADDRPIGGLGIFIVKNFMDDVVYERKNDKNILTLKKKL